MCPSHCLSWNLEHSKCTKIFPEEVLAVPQKHPSISPLLLKPIHYCLHSQFKFLNLYIYSFNKELKNYYARNCNYPL